MLQMIKEQTKQWTEMMKKHRSEEWELLKAHQASYEEVYEKVFETAQAKQMKDLEAFLAKYDS